MSLNKEEIMDGKKNRVILVTGFGPFRGHPTNASWQAVKELRNLGIEKECNVTLVTEQIPVAYESVLTEIPKLWLEHDPMLVVHVGVSSHVRCLTLETRAHKTGYDKLDVFNEKCPMGIEGMDNSSSEIIAALETEVDVKKICDSINCNSSSDEACKAVVSSNAGRYLCEYIFCQSLTIHPSKTLFVHVPDLRIYSVKKTAEGLYQVIKFAIEVLEKAEN